MFQPLAANPSFLGKWIEDYKGKARSKALFTYFNGHVRHTGCFCCNKFGTDDLEEEEEEELYTPDYEELFYPPDNLPGDESSDPSSESDEASPDEDFRRRSSRRSNPVRRFVPGSDIPTTDFISSLEEEELPQLVHLGRYLLGAERGSPLFHTCWVPLGMFMRYSKLADMLGNQDVSDFCKLLGNPERLPSEDEIRAAQILAVEGIQQLVKDKSLLPSGRETMACMPSVIRDIFGSLWDTYGPKPDRDARGPVVGFTEQTRRVCLAMGCGLGGDFANDDKECSLLKIVAAGWGGAVSISQLLKTDQGTQVSYHCPCKDRDTPQARITKMDVGDVVAIQISRDATPHPNGGMSKSDQSVIPDRILRDCFVQRDPATPLELHLGLVVIFRGNHFLPIFVSKHHDTVKVIDGRNTRYLEWATFVDEVLLLLLYCYCYYQLLPTTTTPHTALHVHFGGDLHHGSIHGRLRSHPNRRRYVLQLLYTKYTPMRIKFTQESYTHSLSGIMLSAACHHLRGRRLERSAAACTRRPVGRSLPIGNP